MSSARRLVIDFLIPALPETGKITVVLLLLELMGYGIIADDKMRVIMVHNF